MADENKTKNELAVKGSFNILREGLQGFFAILAQTDTVEDVVQGILLAVGYQRLSSDLQIDSDWRDFTNLLSGAAMREEVSQVSSVRYRVALEESLKEKSSSREKLFEGLRSQDPKKEVEEVLRDIFHNLAAGEIELKIVIQTIEEVDRTAAPTESLSAIAAQSSQGAEESEDFIDVLILSDPITGKSASELKLGDQIMVRVDIEKPVGMAFARSIGAYENDKVKPVPADVILTRQEGKELRIVAYFIEQKKKCAGSLESPEIKVSMATKEDIVKPKERGWLKLVLAIVGGLGVILVGVGIYIFFFR